MVRNNSHHLLCALLHKSCCNRRPIGTRTIEQCPNCRLGYQRSYSTNMVIQSRSTPQPELLAIENHICTDSIRSSRCIALAAGCNILPSRQYGIQLPHESIHRINCVFQLNDSQHIHIQILHSFHHFLILTNKLSTVVCTTTLQINKVVQHVHRCHRKGTATKGWYWRTRVRFNNTNIIEIQRVYLVVWALEALVQRSLQREYFVATSETSSVYHVDCCSCQYLAGVLSGIIVVHNETALWELLGI
mmetsp:Transcript_19143/g.32781  ORF Transcript_19143/g.32781 Transcript_19143/m.32781 type:complete len:246 (-) Transcript_19143:646-1383(-)